MQKFPCLRPAAAAAPCESWELLCDQQAEILSLKTKHTLRSCYTASTLVDRRGGRQDAAEIQQLISLAVSQRPVTQHILVSV